MDFNNYFNYVKTKQYFCELDGAHGHLPGMSSSTESHIPSTMLESRGRVWPHSTYMSSCPSNFGWKVGIPAERPELRARELRTHGRSHTCVSLDSINLRVNVTPTLVSRGHGWIRAMLFPQCSPISKISNRLTIGLHSI